MPTIGLSMIVKNEVHVIERCLASVRPIISHWTIIDTGSTDGTQQRIRELLQDLPGQLIERPWRDFASNRNEALELARPHTDYVLVIDADDMLEYAPDFVMPSLTGDVHDLQIRLAGVVYSRPQIVRSTKPWRWRGVLHEFLDCPNFEHGGTVPGLIVQCNSDGARRRTGDIYRRDAAVLADALETETDPFMRSRYTFYLAQSYRDCAEKERSIVHYLERAELGFWEEEVYVSLHSAAKLMHDVGRPVDETLAVLAHASAVCPRRAEALHTAAQICTQHGRHRQGYDLARSGVDLPLPTGGLFVEPWIYEYGMRDAFATSAYWAEAYVECVQACVTLLAGGTLPQEQRPRVQANAQFALGKLRSPDLGPQGRESLADQHALVAERALRSPRDRHARVLVAILAKQKQDCLPLYLECIDALDYPKSAIVLYVRTNNNTDRTGPILRDWIARVGHLYAGVEFDDTDVPEPVQQFGVHEWNPLRLRVLGRIRDASLRKALDHRCEYYFTADVDNFIRSCTLRELVALDLPIVSPLLRSIGPDAHYANYHAAVDADGYYRECDQYQWALQRNVRGLIEMPVVNCAYLLRADVLHELRYQDATERHEYVVFAESARNAGIPQYLDNRQVYGYVTFDASDATHYLEDGVARARALLQADHAAAWGRRAYEQVIDPAADAHRQFVGGLAA